MPHARIILPRTGTGDIPLGLTGTLRVERSTHGESGVDRWYVLRLYEYAVAGSGTCLAVAIGYRTDRNHEMPLDWAWGGFTALDAASAWARRHSIDDYLTGLPSGPQFDDKRAGIIRQLRTALLAALAQLFTDAGLVEEL